MPTPDFVLDLRRSIGHARLHLTGVTAVVVRGAEVLVTRRTDTGRIAPLAGIVEPGEEPAAAARREALEETGVDIVVDRLAWMHVLEPMTYPNGDEVVYLDLTFRCTHVAGEPYVADDENSEVMWMPIAALAGSGMTPDHLERIRHALSDDPVTAFVR